MPTQAWGKQIAQFMYQPLYTYNHVKIIHLRTLRELSYKMLDALELRCKLGVSKPLGR